jgi:ABC-type nitrate/sulfonate/bicarbonate transport system substrate-binding protein
MPKKKPSVSVPALHLGFVALADCAPLIMARELGLFTKRGLNVVLHREVGWATIRDKILYGELHAAQAPAGLVVASSCGLGTVQVDCLTGLVLNLHGNAITLSQALWNRGVRDGRTLRQEIVASRQLLTFGVVHPFSSHNVLLRHWLRAHGIDPEHDVRIVVVPPPQLHGNLKAGQLDGYCVGEPWNSMAVLARTGWCAAISAELAPGHPEKVLMVTSAFAERSEEQHLALIAALAEACRFCERPENRERIMETLAQPRNVGAPMQALRMSLGSTFDFGNGRVEKVSNFHVFAQGNANEPTAAQGQWVLNGIKECGLADDESLPKERIAEWFRADVYRRAVGAIAT